MKVKIIKLTENEFNSLLFIANGRTLFNSYELLEEPLQTFFNCKSKIDELIQFVK